MMWECLCFSTSVHSRTGLLTLVCPLHVFPKELGPGTVEKSHTMGMLSKCQALQRCLFPPQLWREETIVPISYMRSLGLAWKGHGRQAPEASSFLEKGED